MKKLFCLIFMTIMLTGCFNQSGQEDYNYDCDPSWSWGIIYETSDIDGCQRYGQLYYWAGTYEFVEYAAGLHSGITYVWTHRVFIYHHNGGFFAYLNTNGMRGIDRRFLAKVVGDYYSIDFLFELDFQTGGIHDVATNPNTGYRLLTFRRDGDDVITEWGEFDALVISNQDPGIRFEQTESFRLPPG